MTIIAPVSTRNICSNWNRCNIDIVSKNKKITSLSTSSKSSVFRMVQLLGLVLLLGSLFPIVMASQSVTKEYEPMLFPTTISATSPGGINGLIQDASCTIEDLEAANDSQLHTILQELIKTPFFRSFLVDLDTTCPLHNQSDGEEEEEEFQCGGGGDDNDDSSGFGIGDSSSDGISSIFGGSLEDHDDEDEPLCTVKTSGDGGGNGIGTEDGISLLDVESSVLRSLSSSGYTSQNQKETFDWEQHSDVIVTGKSLGDDTEDCGNETDYFLPDSFWMDMCSKIKQGKNTNMVNLLLNPERNTGYNGTHIWEAIYQENCIFDDMINEEEEKEKLDYEFLTNKDNQEEGGHNQQQDGKCLEQRVLYRLLSGLHTQTTLSIATNYYPPSVRKNRKTWTPNPKLFYERFQYNPEHIRNLHFSYVVMLRALFKATPILKQYASSDSTSDMHIKTGDTVQDSTSRILLNRLLDSSILQTCSYVFRAFDESAMFRGPDSIVLQTHFKNVFHNISSVLDCVQCQQCKLHGKLSMLGYGTALKLLFMKNPYDSLMLKGGMGGLTQNEIVAFINTIAKLSESVREVKTLTQLYWEKQVQEVKKKQGPDTGIDDINNVPQNKDNNSIENTAQSSSSSNTATSSLTDDDADNENDIDNDVPLSHPGSSLLGSWNYVDLSVGLVASLGEKGYISVQREEELLQLAFEKNPKLLILAKHYGDDLSKFYQFTNLSELTATSKTTATTVQ